MTRITVIFTGRVQGVGFRWTARRLAGRYAGSICGWVRNEPDGSVRLVAEGPAEDLEQFLEDIRRAMGGHIDTAKITERTAATGECEGFEIRR